MEEWRVIETSPNYEVSNLGNVRHLLRKNNLKPRPSHKKRGYVCYEVHIAGIDGKQRNRKIHRLVAQAFIPNPENKLEVDHIDRNPANNVLTNLRWATSSENSQNVGMRTDNVSGCSGVFFSTQRQKWLVAFEINKVKQYHGQYNTREEAVAVREKILT